MEKKARYGGRKKKKDKKIEEKERVKEKKGQMDSELE